ncbi:MAG: DUF924 family protein [Mastigocoleus sp. MO_167.B18]|nr:DUF924 family protein [Mastigocoleus sp. MO_167.B18]
MSRAEKILSFWFGEPGTVEYGKPRQIWFQKKPEFDDTLRCEFLSDYEQAINGDLNHWLNLPESCLALILLFDQFPRNMFRGEPQAFATDWEALCAAQHAITQEYDRTMLPVQRWFIYIPFEHSENLEHQKQAVKLFKEISDDPESASVINYAIRHLEVIERFGRFPHRNAILGRASTPEEKLFLKEPGSSF